MTNLKRIFAVSFLAALLSGALFAQQQGPQVMSTTTLNAAITTTFATGVNLASLTNVICSASVQTELWVDTEAMSCTTNTVPGTGTVIQVTRGAYGTKAETHVTGRRVYVSRPNLFQNYDVAGSCIVNGQFTGQAVVRPWINVSNGSRFNCDSGGNWFREGSGSNGSAAIAQAAAFCTGAVTAAQTEFLNGAACAGSTTPTFRYTSPFGAEVANLVVSTSVAVAGPGDVVTVLKNGVATTVTCTIATAALACTDVTHSFTIVLGDQITFSIVAGAGDTAANVSATVGLYGQT